MSKKAGAGGAGAGANAEGASLVDDLRAFVAQVRLGVGGAGCGAGLCCGAVSPVLVPWL